MTTEAAADTAQRTLTHRGMFFVPALALSLAALISGIASIPNSFESAVASLVALLPTIAALVLGHITLEAAQPTSARYATLAGLAASYIALALVVVSLIT